jgi:DNA-binding beta-propeller fold protein YncE
MHLFLIAALTIVGTPHSVPEYGRFDYVTVDSQRGRVYAAHTSSERLLVVDARTGAVLRQIEVGPMHGVAVDERTGDVFTGDGTDDTVSKVDPVNGTVLATVDVPAPIDALAYDPFYDRVYADEDSGNRLFVIDAKKMKLVATITTPGDDHEYLGVDPVTHRLYQNIPDLDEFVVIDPKTLHVVRTVKTPELRSDHPLMIDAKDRTVIVGGKNGVISVYSMDGRKLSQASMPGDVDQCDLDQVHELIGCAGGGKAWVLAIRGKTALQLVASVAVEGAHTLAWDPSTGNLWTVWGAPSGSKVASLRLSP